MHHKDGDNWQVKATEGVAEKDETWSVAEF